MRSLAGAVALVSIACTSGPRGELRGVRFANQPPVWRVNDRRDVDEVPATRPDHMLLDGFDSTIHRSLTRPLEQHDPVRAIGTNSLGEVPDSTWFTNRIGRHGLTPAQIAAGPAPGAAPDLSGKLTVVDAKTSGAAAGFVVEDARGERYIVKFGMPHAPTMETATDLAVQRILWAAGWNVPGNFVGTLTREQLVPPEKSDSEVPITRETIDAVLARAPPPSGGRHRALFSAFLPGKPIGGWPQQGVRPDDPNDTIPHEHRRELRGLGLFVSWLQHTDIREGNTLDVYVQDPRDPDRHYVVHYLIDFGKALGTFMYLDRRVADGHAQTADLYYLQSLFTLGLWKRPWEGVQRPDIRGVGYFDVEHYRPDNFSPQAPYLPFLLADRHDMLWAADIMLRFTPEHLRAALEQGHYEDPRAVDHLVRVLVGRQRKAARHWLAKTSPLVDFRVEERAQGLTICFTDLMVAHELAPGAAARSRYQVTPFAPDGSRLGSPLATGATGDTPTACLGPLSLRNDDEAYTVFKVEAARGQHTLPPVEVHVARTPVTCAPRITGIERW